MKTAVVLMAYGSPDRLDDVPAGSARRTIFDRGCQAGLAHKDWKPGQERKQNDDVRGHPDDQAVARSSPQRMNDANDRNRAKQERGVIVSV